MLLKKPGKVMRLTALPWTPRSNPSALTTSNPGDHLLYRRLSTGHLVENLERRVWRGHSLTNDPMNALFKVITYVTSILISHRIWLFANVIYSDTDALKARNARKM